MPEVAEAAPTLRRPGMLYSLRENLAWIAGFSVAFVVTVWSHIPQWQAWSPAAAIAYSFIGFGWLCTAWLLWRQQGQESNARWFLMLAVFWMVGEVARQDIPVVYQITLATAQYSVILGAAILMRYPLTSFDRIGWWYLTSGLVITTIFAVALALLAAGPGVPTTEPGRILDSLGPWRYNDVERGRWIFWGIYSALAIVLILIRWRRLAAFERRVLAPIIVAAIIAAVGISSGVLDDMLPRQAGAWLGVARGFTVVGVSLAFIISAARLRRARATVADLLERLNGPVTEQTVERALIEVFGDHTIRVHPYASASTDNPTLPEPGQFSMPIPGNSGRPLGVAFFPDQMQRHAPLLRSHLAACGMALENARQLRELHRARERLVQVGLAERRRLERDLHDGAQQRLLALGMGLGALEAQVRDPGFADEIRKLRGELRQAQQELRDLAHGIYPTVLTQAGLGPALESVVERLPVPIELSVPARRWPPDIENTLYLLACEAVANIVKHAGPCRARVEVRESDGALDMRISDDGCGFSLEAVAPAGRAMLGTVHDRVSAMGGTLDIITEPGHGTVIAARVPLSANPDQIDGPKVPGLERP